MLYAAQADAQRAATELPPETSTLVMSSFLGYNNRPWRTRGWGIFEQVRCPPPPRLFQSKGHSPRFPLFQSKRHSPLFPLFPI